MGYRQQQKTNWKNRVLALVGISVGGYVILKLVGGYWSPAVGYTTMIEQYSSMVWSYVNSRIEWVLGLFASIGATVALKTKQYNTLKSESENTINQTQAIASNQVASAQNELEDAKAEAKATLTSTQKNMQGSIDALSDEKKTLTSNLSATQTELADAKTRLQDTSDKLIAVQNDSGKTINDLTTSNQEQASQIQTLTTQIAELKMRVNDLTPHNLQ